MRELPPPSYEFGLYRVDCGRRLLLRDGATVPLTAKAFDLLRTLVESSGRVVEKDELMSRLWPDTVVEENNLSVNMSALRKALGEVAGEHRYVTTIPGRGYQFVAAVRRIDDADDEPLVLERLTRTRIVAEEELDGSEERGRDARPRPLLIGDGGGRMTSRRARLALLVAGTLLIAGTTGSLLYFSGRKENVAGSSFKSIAILPFQPMAAGGGDDEYMRLGMADALITKLSNLKDVSVRPTSAVRKYAGANVDAFAAGRELKVDSVLEGGVQRADGRIRVSVQLISVGDGRPVWAETFEEKYTDIFAVQNAIAERVSAALKSQITEAERERVYRRYTGNVEAYEAYQRGRAQLAPHTRESILAAIGSFEEALRHDPAYALAHAGLANACGAMRNGFATEAEDKMWEARARGEAARAVELDPRLAEAHAALASVYRYSDYEWELTLDESRRALELNPNLDEPHYFRAAAFYHLGLTEMVEGEARAGMENNPGSRRDAIRLRGIAALLGGHFAESVALLEEAGRLRESHSFDPYLTLAYYYLGEREKAEGILTQPQDRGYEIEQERQAYLSSFLAARGERARAGEILRSLTSAPGNRVAHHAAYGIGAAYAQLGDFAAARKWLARAAATGFPCYPWYERDSLLDPLRGDSDFRGFMDGLRKSWEASTERYAR